MSEQPTLFELSRPGRSGVEPPEPDASLPSLADCLTEENLRQEPSGLPDVAESSIVRHYTRLSSLNMSIDTNFYPLGSCTMKYNPRINEVAASNPGFSHVHPLCEDHEIQGYLELFSRLEEMLAEISGLPHVSLQPAAGAHGELASLMMIKARCRKRGELERDVVLIPDSAHGTNPSSCTIAGFKTRNVNSGEDGTIDLDSLREALGPDVAAMMITNPNTLGIFESGIDEISSLLHEAGALLYMDGANMNAILGITRPGDFGVDVMHFNLHKTMSTPHGGGGPGSGPIAVTDELEPYLPVPRIVRSKAGLELCCDRPLSIGKVRSFFGNSGILVRAYAFIRAHGPEEFRGISEHAVLNANYIRHRLEQAYHLPYDTPCMHEVVFTAKKQKASGIRALDIAKRLIDLGYHPPTIYFPLVVHEALMIEPTETETPETLDRFCKAMLQIAREAEENPELLKAAPVTQVVKRLDEVNAVKTPILTCPCDEQPSEPEAG